MVSLSEKVIIFIDNSIGYSWVSFKYKMVAIPQRSNGTKSPYKNCHTLYFLNLDLSTILNSYKFDCLRLLFMAVCFFHCCNFNKITMLKSIRVYLCLFICLFGSFYRVLVKGNDVVVVGAGVSGCAAARTLLQNSDHNVTVLEANPDRYGGRTWTTYTVLSDGTGKCKIS